MRRSGVAGRASGGAAVAPQPPPHRARGTAPSLGRPRRVDGRGPRVPRSPRWPQHRGGSAGLGRREGVPKAILRLFQGYSQELSEWCPSNRAGLSQGSGPALHICRKDHVCGNSTSDEAKCRGGFPHPHVRAPGNDKRSGRHDGIDQWNRRRRDDQPAGCRRESKRTEPLPAGHDDEWARRALLVPLPEPGHVHGYGCGHVEI